MTRTEAPESVSGAGNAGGPDRARAAAAPSAGNDRWPVRLVLWLPVALVAAAAGVDVILRMRVGGAGFDALLWTAALCAAAGIATRSPGRAVLLLIFLLPCVPYLRYDTWPGKALPPALAGGVLAGVALSRTVSWSQLLRDRRRNLALPVLAFATVLAVSILLVLVHRSPTLAPLAPWIGGLGPGDVDLLPQTTLPILRSGGFLLGPVAALAVLALLRSDRGSDQPVLTRDQLIGAFLVTSVVNMSVACGQAFIPGFPLPGHRDVSGLFHNPVGLALLMTMAAPVALMVSLRPGRIGWLRPLAVAALIGVALLFLQVNERSTHVGVTMAVAGAVAAMWLGAGTGWLQTRRRTLVVTAAAALLLAVGLVGAMLPQTSEWRRVGAVIGDAPLSDVWLGMGQRQETNRLAFAMVSDRPLGGLGMGGFDAALPAYYELHGPPVRRYEYHSILNHPLHMWVDLGIAGLAANLWLLGAFVAPGLVAAVAGANRRNVGAGIDSTAGGCLAGTCTFLLLSIWTGEWVYDASTGVLAFVLLALSVPDRDPVAGDRRVPARWFIVGLPLVHALAFALDL